ncbi:hypothetical protein J3458_018779 [Metarhizium acridum]|uniref:uncharacterized protein n=1 Tax=Metarhizium acridum TaxID=92637 RepID=UPI001C6AC5D1|nr:hypothetical protein J3458_018779 [Metarhizium acridum]
MQSDHGRSTDNQQCLSDCTATSTRQTVTSAAGEGEKGSVQMRFDGNEKRAFTGRMVHGRAGSRFLEIWGVAHGQVADTSVPSSPLVVRFASLENQNQSSLLEKNRHETGRVPACRARDRYSPSILMAVSKGELL